MYYRHLCSKRMSFVLLLDGSGRKRRKEASLPFSLQPEQDAHVSETQEGALGPLLWARGPVGDTQDHWNQ